MPDRPADRISFAAQTLPSRRSPNVAAVNRLFGLGRAGSCVPILQHAPIPERGIVYITGPSGSGKSTFLRLLGEARTDATVAGPPADPATPLIDLFGTDFSSTIAWLGRFGLGEARLMTTPYALLSDGQKARAMLALAAWDKPSCIIADEFLSVLDRTNARLVAYNFQKVCRSEGINAFLATAHDDLIEALAPDHVLRLDLGAEWAQAQLPAGQEALVSDVAALSLDSGDAEDFHELSRFHYIEHLASEGPLTDLDWRHVVKGVRVARHRGRPVGVAVFSRPFSDIMERIPFFRLVNERLLIVLRVVVHPTFRGVGLTKPLLQPETEPEVRALVACSALGIHFPFFIGAGFVRAEHPRCLRYLEHDALEELLRDCSDELLDDLNNYDHAQRYYDGLAAGDRVALRSVVTAICVRMNVDYAVFHGEIAGLDVGPDERALLEEIFLRLAKGVPEEKFGTMLSEALFFPAAGFVKMLTPGGG